MKTFKNIMRTISINLAIVTGVANLIGIIDTQEAMYAMILMIWIYITNENNNK